MQITAFTVHYEIVAHRVNMLKVGGPQAKSYLRRVNDYSCLRVSHFEFKDTTFILGSNVLKLF